MAGLLELFADGAFNLSQNAHSRKAPNQALTEEFVVYNPSDGAAQELHTLISAPLPYSKNMIDTQG